MLGVGVDGGRVQVGRLIAARLGRQQSERGSGAQRAQNSVRPRKRQV